MQRKQEDEMVKRKMIPAIICGGATGRAVIYGYVDHLPASDEPVRIERARMVLYWPAACGGLLGLAAGGPRDGLRLTHIVLEVTDTCRQSIAVSADAATALDEWPHV